MGFKFPYGNSQQLNLNWFIKKFKELLADWQHEKESIDGALDAEIQRAEDALSDVYTARDTTIAAKNDALQAKADALTAAANAAQYWQNAAASANSAATSAVTALQAAQDAADNADQTSRDRALVSADKAAVAADKATVAADKAAVAADKAAVQQDKDDVDTLKDAANAAALRSEGWADGTQNGTPVASDSPYYQNNSKYFKEEAEAVLESIPEDYSDLAAEVAAQGEKIADELEDSVNCTNILEPYFLHGTVGPTGRKFTIDGNKYKNISGSGSAYQCYNLLSKTNALHYGSGTAGGITTFFNTYKNDVWFPMSLLASPNFQYDIYFTIKNKIKTTENKTLFRFYVGDCTETDGNITAVNSFTLLSNISDTSATPYISAYFSGAILSQYSHFALMIESMLPHNQETEFNIYRLRHPPYNGYITQYNFLTYKATTAVPAGKLIMVGNQLYKTTAAIANGATLTPNTNITATTLDAVISAL